AAAPVPDGRAEAALGGGVELVQDVGTDLQRLDAVRQQPGRLDDVGGLAFEHVDDGAGAHVRVGPVHEEEVGEAGDGHAEVGARAVLPGRVQLLAVQADDAHGRDKVLGAEAGGPDDGVEDR